MTMSLASNMCSNNTRQLFLITYDTVGSILMDVQCLIAFHRLMSSAINSNLYYVCGLHKSYEGMGTLLFYIINNVSK